MAIGKQYGTYSLDNGQLYAMLVNNNRHADAAFGWATPAAGTPLVPRGVKLRRVYGVSATTGRRGSAVVPGTESQIWTGAATTFDMFHNDGTADTMTVTARKGELVRLSH
jgi:hypothetical protein